MRKSSALGCGEAEPPPRRWGTGEAVKQPRRGARGEAAKRGRDQEVPRTGSSLAKQGGAVKARRERDPVKIDQTPGVGSSGADQAAGAANPRTGSSRDKRRHGAPDWIIRGWRPDAQVLGPTGRTEAGPVIRV